MVIAGGGTGGHLFPALALAEEIVKRGGEVLLVGSGRKVEEMALADTGLPVKYLQAEGVCGRRFHRKLIAAGKLLSATVRAFSILKSFSPRMVFGVGGYASFPTLLAAKFLGLKTAIHEQNAIPGRANQLLGHLVDRVFVTFPLSARFFPSGKVVVSGMPLREEVLKNYPREHDGFGLLVMGGSQGARFINRLFIELAPKLRELKGLFLIHQTGERDFSAVKKAYEEAGLRAQVFPFIRKMGWAYSQADLVVSRAGAASVAEICALRKPAILVPYPYAIRDHQAANARALVQAGGALMFREEKVEPAAFWQALRDLAENPLRREEMAQNLQNVLPQDALATILEETEVLLGNA